MKIYGYGGRPGTHSIVRLGRGDYIVYPAKYPNPAAAARPPAQSGACSSSSAWRQRQRGPRRGAADYSVAGTARTNWTDGTDGTDWTGQSQSVSDLQLSQIIMPPKGSKKNKGGKASSQKSLLAGGLALRPEPRAVRSRDADLHWGGRQGLQAARRGDLGALLRQIQQGG